MKQVSKIASGDFGTFEQHYGIRLSLGEFNVWIMPSFRAEPSLTIDKHQDDCDGSCDVMTVWDDDPDYLTIVREFADWRNRD